MVLLVILIAFLLSLFVIAFRELHRQGRPQKETASSYFSNFKSYRSWE